MSTRLLTIDELAEALSISKVHAQRMVATGKLPPGYNVGLSQDRRHLRYDLDEVKAALRCKSKHGDQ